MKKLLVVVAVVAVGAVLATAALAVQGYGPGYGRQVDVNAFKQFQKETLPLRDELAVKRLELRNEYTAENPNQARITKLQDEVGQLQTKIRSVAEKNGLPAWGNGPGMGAGPGGGPGYGRGGRMMGRGGYGCGPRMTGGGSGRGCPAWY